LVSPRRPAPSHCAGVRGHRALRASQNDISV